MDVTIEGKNEFGDVCRREGSYSQKLGAAIRRRNRPIDRRRQEDHGGAAERCRHEAETYSLFRRVCPDCHRFRTVKDYTARRIRTVFCIAEVRNQRWMLCRECYPGVVGAFAPLKEICPDRSTPVLMELSARLGSMMPYRKAAGVLAEFLPVEPTETHATVRKRTIRIGERLEEQIAEERTVCKVSSG